MHLRTARLLFLCLSSFAIPACVDDDPTIKPDPEEARGPVELTTYANGEITGGLRVYTHDNGGELRAGYISGEDGKVVVSVGDNWSVSVIDDREGFRHVDTILDVTEGDVLAIGRRRKVLADTRGELLIGRLEPIVGAQRYTVSVCGPVVSGTPISDPSVETMIYYDAHLVDDAGGALVVAEATVGGQRQVALLDTADVATLPQPVQFPAWQPLATASARVIAPPGAFEVEVSLRSVHGCSIGTGSGAGPEVAVQRYPELPVTMVAASGWFRRDAVSGSRVTRRVAVDPAAPLPELSLADPPPRIDAVTADVFGSATVLSWEQLGDADPARADGLVIVAGPTVDLEWTLIGPPGATSLILPRLAEVPAGAPDWINVSLVDLDNVDGYADLAQRAGLPLRDEPGWVANATLTTD